MSSKNKLVRMRTGIPNFDALLSGGLPRGSVVVVGGPPGAGKSILTQQICFTNAGPECPVLYFNTLSEPTAKTLLHLSQFDFFDAAKLHAEQLQYIDIGSVLRKEGLEKADRRIMEDVRRFKPGLVVIDSFKAFDDFARSHAELRKFGYDLAVGLMAWQTTTILLGEFGPRDLATNPLFSIIDGLLVMSQREASGEQQRFLQIVKMRGTAHSRNEYPFQISDGGIDIFAPHLTVPRTAAADTVPARRMKTGIDSLDELLGDGIPRGSSILVGGVAGTGKTVLLLEFLYRGALAGEKGILFSFEETEARLRATAAGLGWDFERLMGEGLIEIVFIPQPEIAVERDLAMVQHKVEAENPARIAFDSVSLFLHRINDPERSREKLYQIASIVQRGGSVGLLAADIPYGSSRLSRYGVEETVVDGVILLSATEEGFERQRYVEVYKLRNTAHLQGRHSMAIEEGGIRVYPRYYAAELLRTPPPPMDPDNRLSTGIEGLDRLLCGGLLEKSVTLVSGSTGSGKTTLGLQFALEGARQKERTLFVALEEGPAQIIESGEALALPARAAVEAKSMEVLYLSRQSVRANRFFAVLQERIQAHGVRRLVIDSVSQLLTEGHHPEDRRQMLYGLVSRFKSLGVTTLFTLEAGSPDAADRSTEEGFSPIADNVIMLRYGQDSDRFRPYLSIVKTRGSRHLTGFFALDIGRGGIRVAASPADAPLSKGKSDPS